MELDKYLEERNKLNRQISDALIEELIDLSSRYRKVFGDEEGVKRLVKDVNRIKNTQPVVIQSS